MTRKEAKCPLSPETVQWVPLRALVALMSRHTRSGHAPQARSRAGRRAGQGLGQGVGVLEAHVLGVHAGGRSAPARGPRGPTGTAGTTLSGPPPWSPPGWGSSAGGSWSSTHADAPPSPGGCGVAAACGPGSAVRPPPHVHSLRGQRPPCAVNMARARGPAWWRARRGQGHRLCCPAPRLQSPVRHQLCGCRPSCQVSEPQRFHPCGDCVPSLAGGDCSRCA